jgi:beta-barrel assembly-enhancing protease
VRAREPIPVRRLAAAALLVATAGCAELRKYPGGAALADAAERNAALIAQNAVNAARSGELSKDATFSMEQEHYLGKTVAASVVARLGGEALPPEHPASAYLRNVGAVVVAAAAELRAPDARPFPLTGFRFIPVESTQVNAVGSPGGFVVVTTGLLRAVRSEDELAAVLAHEVAHVQLGHPMQPVEAARKQEQLTGVLLAGTSDVVHGFFGKVVSAGTDFVLDRGFGKQHELAADALAARILAGAGYDPGALPAFLGRLEGAAAKGGFFSRHPPAAERIRALGPLVVTAAARPPPDGRRARFAMLMATLLR